MKSKLLIINLLIAIYSSIYPVFSIAQPGQVKANGITIAYESFGSKDKPTILLIAGTNGQLTMWPVEFCEGLVKKGYRVIRFDNRDIGLSTKFDKAGQPDWAAISKALQERTTPPLPYSLDDMAADAVGLLDALGIKKAHIVGVSMGAMIAQRVAYNHPEHTLSLASIAAGGGSPTFPLVAKPDVIGKIPAPGMPTDTSAYVNREVLSRIALEGNTYKTDEKALLNEVKTDVARSYYPDGLVRQGAASLSAFYGGRQEKLKTIKVPTVVIHGDEDPLVVVDAGKDVAANISDSNFQLITGMGHAIPKPLFGTLIELITKNAALAQRTK